MTLFIIYKSYLLLDSPAKFKHGFPKCFRLEKFSRDVHPLHILQQSMKHVQAVLVLRSAMVMEGVERMEQKFMFVVIPDAAVSLLLLLLAASCRSNEIVLLSFPDVEFKGKALSRTFKENK